MTMDNSNQINRVFVSEENLYPKSIISDNYYTNSVRLGFLMSTLENNRSIQFTPTFLRLILNLYLSSKKLWKTSIALGINSDYLPTSNAIENKVTISEFHEILGLLLAKGLISIDKKKSNTDQPVFELENRFRDLIENFEDKNKEANMLKKIELIENIMKSWNSNNFIEFIKNELKDLI